MTDAPTEDTDTTLLIAGALARNGGIVIETLRDPKRRHDPVAQENIWDTPSGADDVALKGSMHSVWEEGRL